MNKLRKEVIICFSVGLFIGAVISLAVLCLKWVLSL